jgi:5,10-methenyltetrahydrofolate synthetase
VSDNEYRSPACSMHEVERLAPPKTNGWEDVRAWRKLQRDALIKARPQDPNERRSRSGPILEQISAELRAFSAVPHAAVTQVAEGDASAKSRSADDARAPRDATPGSAVALPVLGIYWPFRGEIDVRDLAHRHIEAGGVVALPVVVEKNTPVQFWRWRPDVPMSRGLFNIPIPGECEVLTPQVLIVPLVGFDRAGYRLGYGGGYYDRTLAASQPRPRTIGIAFSEAALETIYPQPHDIPMSCIITEVQR